MESTRHTGVAIIIISILVNKTFNWARFIQLLTKIDSHFAHGPQQQINSCPRYYPILYT